MLRAGSRLQYSTLEYQSKHQLLLPSKHHVTKLLIMDVHESVGHLGQKYVLSSLRQKYWIVQGWAAVRRVLGNCLTCQKKNAQKGQQLMADLPRFFTASWLAQLVERQSAVRKVEGSSPRPDQHSGS